jgi:hypothetical protein
MAFFPRRSFEFEERRMARSFERAAAAFERLEPEEGELCGDCHARGVDVDLVEDECPRCSRERDGEDS